VVAVPANPPQGSADLPANPPQGKSERNVLSLRGLYQAEEAQLVPRGSVVVASGLELPNEMRLPGLLPIFARLCSFRVPRLCRIVPENRIDEARLCALCARI
jgi:hypothetical protein